MIRSVVVPLDGSLFAEQALPHALALARSGAELHVVMVHVPVRVEHVIASGTDTWTARVMEQEREYLTRVRDRIEAAAGVRPSTALLEGAVAERLAGYLKDHHADVAVIATHGRGGLSRAWLGSVADRLIRLSASPVLTVRPTEPPAEVDLAAVWNPGSVVVALDGSEVSETVLPHALRIGEPLAARFVLLRVISGPHLPPSPYLPHAARMNAEVEAARRAEAESYLADIREWLADGGHEVATHVEGAASAAAGVLHFAARHAAGMIALATHGRSGVARSVLGSVADKVVRQSSLPVLLVRAGA